jgi:6-phosphogluconolactonase
MAAPHQLIVVVNADALAKAAAERPKARIAANDGRIAICLAGGARPKKLYELLATDDYRARIPSDRIHRFIGDERVAPSPNPRNNMAMARRIFLDRPAPAPNIHPIPTDVASPNVAPRGYEHELKAFYSADVLDPTRPLFDLARMGVGGDGHCASLFPDDPALREAARWVIGVPQAPVEPLVPRVTLTLPALACCGEMLFEAAGVETRAILTRLLAGEKLPANRARSHGETVWLIDSSARPETFRDG